MAASSGVTIRVLTADELDEHIRALGALLHACVHAGASVGFILPFGDTEAEGYWQTKVGPALGGGRHGLWIAKVEDALVGTAQLAYDTFPNQAHRADVSKVLVHPAWRRRGIARALMAELEREALRLGRTLLTLDTRTGDMAEPLYTSLGFTTAGVIPGYCRDPVTDHLDSTTLMYKWLGADGPLASPTS